MDNENNINIENADDEVINEQEIEQEDVSQDTSSQDIEQEENELIYQYPVAEMRENYEDYFKQEYRRNKKTLHILAYMSIGFLLCFTLYSVTSSSRLSSVFLIVGVVVLLLTFMFAKGVANKRSLHLLSIDADEKRLKLTYYTQQKYYKREYEIPYNRILSCRFANNDYTKIQFVLKNTKSYFYNINNEVDKTETTSFMVFNLNPLSYEQGYFMYVADKYFDIKGYQLTNKIIKKYGNMEEYFEYLQEGSGEE